MRPVLVPELSYEGLEAAEGGEASQQLFRLLLQGVSNFIIQLVKDISRVDESILFNNFIQGIMANY